MKVFELMSVLSKLPAGAEIYVSLESTARSAIIDVTKDGDSVVEINCEAAMIYDTNGDAYCLTNEIEPDLPEQE